MKLIIDAHLDLAWNAMSYDRDQLLPITELRAGEAHMTGKGRGNCTVSLPQMRHAGVAVCLATLLARARPASQKLRDKSNSSSWSSTADSVVADRHRGEMILRENLDYANQTIASAAAAGQLSYYRLLEQQGHLRMICDAEALYELWLQWAESRSTHAPIGYILSMEGADPIMEPEHAAWWWQQGLRTACLAHYGHSAYAMGTGGDGSLTEKGHRLLQQFDHLGIILDLTHTADKAVAQALELYEGPVFVSHGNCRELVDHDRQFSDEQIRRIVQRGGVIGVVLDCWMIVPEYSKGSSNRSKVTLDLVANHIDHICQLAQSVNHVGIGSDLDGGFGTEQTPSEIDTIADLQKLAPILSRRGYSDADVDQIFHGNWLRFFRRALP